MATNGVNTSEDAEMAECDGEKVVTMMDVLQEQQDFEEDANAVLGASDDKNCTYSKGYVKRQAIYACLTCCPEASKDPMKRAGVCLACSLACHENHDLVELYTKRNFRCDCGNPKFTQPCQFTPNKTDLNYENKYSQNFSGIYCKCKRPYPDPECVEEEEMLQCIVCEDWLHTHHLEATIPNNDQYAEMICKACMEDMDFLHDYSDLVVNVEDKEITVMDPDLDVTNVSKAKEIVEKDETSTNVEAEVCKEKNETVPDNIDSNMDENNKDETTNAEINKSEPDQSGDGNVPQEKTDDVDQTLESEASKDTNSESNKEQDIDNNENKEENIESENNKSDENISEKNVVTEENSIDPPIEAETNAIDKTVEADKTDNATDENKETIETSESSKVEADSATDNNMDKEITITTDEKSDVDRSQENEITGDSSNAVSDKENEMPIDKQEHKRKLSVDDNDISPKKPKLVTSPCARPKGVKRVYKGATFWPHTFRHKLCTCTECLAMYKDLAVLFLIDPDDTVTAYEALGKENIDGAPSSQYEKGLQALSSLDRVQQINALTEYNKMRDKLLDFLKSFKERQEVVKEEDIKAFFAGMKPKREPDGVYFCR